MGRTNRSRKRRDEMNKIKKERYAAKELIRLKKTLGLIDADGNEIMKDVSEVCDVKSSENLTKKKSEEEKALAEVEEDIEIAKSSGPVEVVNEHGVKHIYNPKTFKDQFGNYPPWFNARKTRKRLNKKAHARKKRFRQAWCTTNVPL